MLDEGSTSSIWPGRFDQKTLSTPVDPSSAVTQMVKPRVIDINHPPPSRKAQFFIGKTRGNTSRHEPLQIHMNQSKSILGPSSTIMYSQMHLSNAATISLNVTTPHPLISKNTPSDAKSMNFDPSLFLQRPRETKGQLSAYRNPEKHLIFGQLAKSESPLLLKSKENGACTDIGIPHPTSLAPLIENSFDGHQHPFLPHLSSPSPNRSRSSSSPVSSNSSPRGSPNATEDWRPGSVQRIPSLPSKALPLSTQRVIWEAHERVHFGAHSYIPALVRDVKVARKGDRAEILSHTGGGIKLTRSMGDLARYRGGIPTSSHPPHIAHHQNETPDRQYFSDPHPSLTAQMDGMILCGQSSMVKLSVAYPEIQSMHAPSNGDIYMGAVEVARNQIPARSNLVHRPQFYAQPSSYPILNVSNRLPLAPVPSLPLPQTSYAPYDAPIAQEIRASNLVVDDSILTPSYFLSISTDVMRIFHSVGMTFCEIDQQSAFLVRLRSHLHSLVPRSVLRRCGDPNNRTGIHGDEIIVLLYDPTQGLRDPNMMEWVNKLGLYLKKLGMKDVKILYMAKPPMIKFRDQLSLIKIQLFIQSPLVELTANLLDAYYRIDDRAKQLLAAVKYWAKRRGILDYTSMSSDCFVHMVVHLLQRRGILPCLQSLYPMLPFDPSPYMIDGVNTYFFADIANISSVWACQNQESVGELIVAFFKYYATEFPYVHGVASIRVGSLLSKEEKGWTKEIQIDNQRMGGIGSRDRFWLCIEDPMDVTFNVCRSVDKEALFEIRGEFIRASKLLCNGTKLPGERILAKVCEIGGNLCQQQGTVSSLHLASSVAPETPISSVGEYSSLYFST